MTKVDIDIISILLSNETKLTTWLQTGIYSSLLQFSVLHSFTDADKQPADSLIKVAAFDVDKLLSKASTTSEGAIFNIWGLESLGVLPEDTMQQLLMEVKILNFKFVSFVS